VIGDWWVRGCAKITPQGHRPKGRGASNGDLVKPPLYLRLSAVTLTFSSALTEPALRAEVLNMRKKVK
jgi:hypothetical protein